MIPPYCTSENENIWRWTTEDGMFQASITNYYGSFALTFHRWLGNKYSPGWERIYYFEKDQDRARRLFVRAVEVGIEAFLEEEKLAIKLPRLMEERNKLPASQSIIRTIRKRRYKFVWSMNWGTPWHQVCPVEMKHWCGATIRIEEMGSYGQRLAVPEEVFPCCDIEHGWERYQGMIADPSIPLMEALL